MNKRDIKLDVLRGIAILTITLNHFSFLCGQAGMTKRQFPTLTAFGYSSAAEIFFLLSGYLIGYLYLRPEKQASLSFLIKRFWERATKLYFYNAMLFLVMFSIAFHGGHELLSLTYYDYVQAKPTQAVHDFLLFKTHPFLLGILQVYIVFLLIAPFFAMTLRMWQNGAIAILLVVYLATQYFVNFNLVGGPPGRGGYWVFNPFSWQLLFFGGMILGRNQILAKFGQVCQTRPALAKYCGMGFILFTLIYLLDIYGHRFGLGFDMPGTEKTSLGPVRILHIAVVITAFLAVFTRLPQWLNSYPARWLATVGSFSLESFAASIVISYLCTSAWLIFGKSYGLYWLLCLLAIPVSIGFAYLYKHWRWLGSQPNTATVVNATPPAATQAA